MNDFLIIGGGIAGLSVGARLSALGKVTLLEAEHALGYHTSGRSAAMFEQTYGSPSTVALNHASYEYHENANGGVLSPRGLMLVGSSKNRAAFESDMKTMSMHPLSMKEALDFVPILDPDAVELAGYHAEAWDIDTDRLMQNFAKEIRRNGGEIILNSRVEVITRQSAGWQVACKNAEYQGTTFINAAGSWADIVAQLAGIEPIGLTPFRRSMARIPAPNDLDVRAWPMMFGPGEDWYAKPDAGQLLISPAEEHLSEPCDAWADDLVLAEGIARYEENVTVPVTRLTTSWAGLRTFSPDRNLVIGFEKTDPTYFWFAGQGGYGFQTSPAASQFAADLISGAPSILPEEAQKMLNPARFRN